MQAAILSAYGGPEVISVQEVQRPAPKANEILIKVHASSATKADTMMRKGTPKFARLMLGLTKPKHTIPGTGFSGEVVGMGKDVSNYQSGDAVFGETNLNFGANAEYVCVPAEGVVLTKPADISHDEAATLCDGPVTSLNFLQNVGQVKAGQQVLIIGASGSLGTAAVQMAKNMGAQVTAVCSGANAVMVKALGADAVIDYQTTDYTQGTATYDVVYDTVGVSEFCACKSILKDGGRYISPVLTFKLLLQMLWTSRFGGKRALFSATGLLPVQQLKTMLENLTAQVASKQVNIVIDRVYSLNQLREAHAYIDTDRKKGNVVISSQGAL